MKNIKQDNREIINIIYLVSGVVLYYLFGWDKLDFITFLLVLIILNDKI